ncbi:MAG TPA: aminodeoxychorismate synthase component I [Usitatibacteraceae bacterium]|nr:aminodeoxychorismate synthase component I [Usitatibacteraceae bacterium]
MHQIRCEIDFPLLATLTPAERLRLSFAAPRAVHVARRPEEVSSLIAAVEAASLAGNWCVGFVAHEAAPAFDAALQVRAPGEAPLAWFAEFAAPGAAAASPRAEGFSLTPWTIDIGHDAYRSAIESIRADIRDGRFYQVNFTARLHSRFSGDAGSYFRALQREQPGGYHAFIDAGDWALLSVSPELFFTLHDGHITTQPMKGTAPRGDTAEADDRIAWALTHSDKERAENLMIVDLLRNDLSRVAAPRSVEVAALFALQPLPSVWQMVSTINAGLRPGVGLLEVFRALFPCGSVTGAPKVEAMRAIRSLEQSPRGTYCGAIGYVAPAVDGKLRACFNVGIRSIWIEHARATAGVGGGITWDSTVDGEWAEMIYKGRYANRAARDFELLETLLLSGGEYAELDAHLARMENSARHFRFAFDRIALVAALERLASAHPQGAWRVRLLGERDGHARAEAHPLGALPANPRVRLADAPVLSADEFLQHKTTRRETYDLHAPPGQAAFDTLLWNERGELTEFTRANLVLEIDGRHWTPPASAGLLNGVQRERLLREGRLFEKTLLREDLSRAASIGWINSVRGWVRVGLAD